jgi:hypothetical protein
MEHNERRDCFPSCLQTWPRDYRVQAQRLPLSQWSLTGLYLRARRSGVTDGGWKNQGRFASVGLLGRPLKLLRSLDFQGRQGRGPTFRAKRREIVAHVRRIGPREGRVGG